MRTNVGEALWTPDVHQAYTFVKCVRIMLVSLCGNVTFTKLVHSRNALAPILVRLCGNVTFTKLVHSRNALAPILVRLCGNVMLTKLVHLLNAVSPILVRF